MSLNWFLLVLIKKVYSFLGDQGNNMYLFNNKNIQSRVNTCILTSQITDIFKRINQLKCQVTDKSDETGRMCQVTDIFGHSHRCSVLTYIYSGNGMFVNQHPLSNIYHLNIFYKTKNKIYIIWKVLKYNT